MESKVTIFNEIHASVTTSIEHFRGCTMSHFRGFYIISNEFYFINLFPKNDFVSCFGSSHQLKSHMYVKIHSYVYLRFQGYFSYSTNNYRECTLYKSKFLFNISNGFIRRALRLLSIFFRVFWIPLVNDDSNRS